MYNCPDCNEAFEKGSAFCQKCACNLEQNFFYDPVCPVCTKSFDDGTQFCDDDGSKLTTSDNLIPKCVECGKEYGAEAKFCPDDGQAITTQFELDKNNSQTFEASDEEQPKMDVNVDYQVHIGDYFSTGMNLFKQNLGNFIGFTLVFLIINSVLSFIPVVGSIISMGVNGPLVAGYYLVAKKLINNETTEFGDFFAGFSYFLPLFLAGLVSSLFITLGILLLVLPGIYLAVGYFFTTLLIIDKDLTFFEAMETSRKLVTKRWFSFFGFGLLIGLLNMCGVLLFGLGMMFTVPLTMCAIAAAYDDIVNNQLV